MEETGNITAHPDPEVSLMKNDETVSDGFRWCMVQSFPPFFKSPAPMIRHACTGGGSCIFKNVKMSIMTFGGTENDFWWNRKWLSVAQKMAFGGTL